MNGRATALLGLLAAPLLLPGCAACPAPAASCERLGQDLFVVATSPLQVPWIAARDAWEWSGRPDHSRGWLPVAFVGGVLLQTGLMALHAVDVAATPLHFVAGNGPAAVFDGCALPLERTAEPLGPAAGELALWGAAGVGGVVVGWWFGHTYVPHLFARFH